MSCEPTIPPPELDGTQIIPAPPGLTTLIKFPYEPKEALTANRECDAVTAVKRGLREYLEQAYLDVYGVRFAFARVLDVWAEPEGGTIDYPSAVVMTSGEASFDAAGFTPHLNIVPVINEDEPAGKKTYLIKYAEAVVPLVIELHTTSPEERINAAMLLEDVLNPVDWMYGFKLRLPHYFNQVAVFEPATAQMLDSEGDARRRFRPGSVILQAQVSLVRPRALPGLQTRVVVDVEDSST